MSAAGTVLAIYECESGNCVRTAGFVHGDSSNYYEVPVSGASKLMSAELVASCDENIGKMKSGGNFCNDSTGVAIATIDANYIINDGAYKFVRGINHIVSITALSGNIYIYIYKKWK